MQCLIVGLIQIKLIIQTGSSGRMTVSVIFMTFDRLHVSSEKFVGFKSNRPRLEGDPHMI